MTSLCVNYLLEMEKPIDQVAILSRLDLVEIILLITLKTFLNTMILIL